MSTSSTSQPIRVPGTRGNTDRNQNHPSQGLSRSWDPPSDFFKEALAAPPLPQRSATLPDMGDYEVSGMFKRRTVTIWQLDGSVEQTVEEVGDVNSLRLQLHRMKIMEATDAISERRRRDAGVNDSHPVPQRGALNVPGRERGRSYSSMNSSSAVPGHPGRFSSDSDEGERGSHSPMTPFTGPVRASSSPGFSNELSTSLPSRIPVRRVSTRPLPPVSPPRSGLTEALQPGPLRERRQSAPPLPPPRLDPIPEFGSDSNEGRNKQG